MCICVCVRQLPRHKDKTKLTEFNALVHDVYTLYSVSLILMLKCVSICLYLSISIVEENILCFKSYTEVKCTLTYASNTKT